MHPNIGSFMNCILLYSRLKYIEVFYVYSEKLCISFESQLAKLFNGFCSLRVVIYNTTKLDKICISSTDTLRK